MTLLCDEWCGEQKRHKCEMELQRPQAICGHCQSSCLRYKRFIWWDFRQIELYPYPSLSQKLIFITITYWLLHLSLTNTFNNYCIINILITITSLWKYHYHQYFIFAAWRVSLSQPHWGGKWRRAGGRELLARSGDIIIISSSSSSLWCQDMVRDCHRAFLASTMGLCPPCLATRGAPGWVLSCSKLCWWSLRSLNNLINSDNSGHNFPNSSPSSCSGQGPQILAQKVIIQEKHSRTIISMNIS